MNELDTCAQLRARIHELELREANLDSQVSTLGVLLDLQDRGNLKIPMKLRQVIKLLVKLYIENKKLKVVIWKISIFGRFYAS